MTDSPHNSNESASKQKPISHPRFAAYYNRLSNRPETRRMEDPWRRELVGQAQGIVLEIGAGGGQNFSFYNTQHVTHLEATEPDETMLATARQKLATAPIPITLTQAQAETLPFPDVHFDTVVVTLVFCSVGDPAQSLQEIWRVLKPEGTLLMLEHVRSQSRIAAWTQSALVPLTTRLAGNCHWNRDTAATVRTAGFQIQSLKQIRNGLVPIISLVAQK